VLRQDAILHQANDAVLRILIKFSWHVPDFPIYSNGTKPGTLQPALRMYKSMSPDRDINPRQFY
ncbi:hypothetical protein, partial [Corynebacterium striatum]|uniref:hypothetical protein n=1 Tax=Corynebacterium striatum TaxID=43770 RepID=UPI003B5A0C68